MFKSSSGQKAQDARVPRHSSGWADLLKHLQATESLRLLDVGATSSDNINFLTGLGHSVYMANFVEDAARPEWRVPVEAGGPENAKTGETAFDTAGYLNANATFAGRGFDVIALWDALDYLPQELIGPLVNRLHEVLAPGGKLLAFFHTKMASADNAFVRYHLTNTSVVQMQKIGIYPILQTFQNRQIERLFQAFANYRFFLAKDGVQEVIATR
jgi:hypothetical protein